MLQKITPKIKFLNKDAILPEYAHVGDSGVDLRCLKDYVINPGQIVLIDTGIAVQMETGVEAQIRPRSSLATKRGLTVPNSPGTVDSTYRGEIKVALINLGQHVQQINKGERIAQMVFAPVLHAEFKVVDEFDETERGEGGFGSTGVK